MEGAGTVEAVGDEVDGFAPGDRVAWCDVLGSDAELAVVPEGRAVAVPDGVDLEIAAAVLLQGVTAHYLATDTYPLEAGDRALVHAAAGGAGQLLVQVAKRRGAEVFATAGGPAKVEIARRAGADHAIDYLAEDFKEAVEAIAGTKAIAVVYDGVGAATFERGLELLRPRGMMVAFGNASGPPPPLDVLQLMRLGSLFVTRPTIGNYIATTDELERRAEDLFEWIAAGDLRVDIGRRYPLEQTADAHRALEARETTGKVLLIP
jgi:NADPH2:quinone reductase